jgi:hypothetical protein
MRIRGGVPEEVGNGLSNEEKSVLQRPKEGEQDFCRP